MSYEMRLEALEQKSQAFEVLLLKQNTLERQLRILAKLLDQSMKVCDRKFVHKRLNGYDMTRRLKDRAIL